MAAIVAASIMSASASVALYEYRKRNKMREDLKKEPQLTEIDDAIEMEVEILPDKEPLFLTESTNQHK